MQQTKTIKIFLGSSITELHYERLHLADYLMNSVRPIFKQDGIEIEVCKFEDIRSENIGRSPQNKIDTLLRGCDVSVFMFKSKASNMTVHEFDVARQLQKIKRHEIYVFCFDVPEADKSPELKDFQDGLIKEGFYWHDCKDFADLESKFILGLLKYERHLLGMKPTTDIEQESITEKDGDAWFEKYQHYEQEQSRLREEIHQDIDDLLQQTETVMGNKDETIAAKIIKVIELYKKADRWASKTDYDKEKYSDLLFDYAQFLFDYGLYRDAESIYLRQIPLAEELYGAEHENTATSYNNIGAVYMEQGDYGRALEYYQKALAIREKVLGPEHPSTATSYNNIGVVHKKQGDYGKALEYHQKALAIREKVLGTEHPSTATSYNNIGLVYDAQGDYGKAMEYYQKALEISEKAIGTEHPDTATTYDNIGLVYDEQGDYGKALEYYQKALEIREKVLGTEHPITATSYNNIGSVYKNQGDYGKALESYVKALSIREKVLGTEHPDTASSYNNIGWIYYEQGDYNKASEYYKKALVIREKVFGTNHPDTAQSHNNIGTVYYNQGEYDKALEHYLIALEIREKVLGAEHPITATTYNDIGSVYYNQSDYNQALEFYQKALKIREKVLGTEHPITAQSYNNIGMVYCKQRHYDDALKLCKKGLKIMEKVLGIDHPDIATSYSFIGEVYRERLENAKALENYEKALAIREKVLGTEHPATVSSYYYIGTLYWGQKEYNKAMEYFHKAFAIIDKNQKQIDFESHTFNLLLDSIHDYLKENNAKHAKNYYYSPSGNELNTQIKCELAVLNSEDKLLRIYEICTFAAFENNTNFIQNKLKQIKEITGVEVFLAFSVIKNELIVLSLSQLTAVNEKRKSERKETIKTIKSFSEYYELIKEICGNKVQDQQFFFRGQPDMQYDPLPSIYRKGRIEKESHLYHEAIRRNPKEFTEDMSTFDKLVKMQHYELPTRLLDITKNPLVALFFACQKDFDADGEVLVYSILRDMQIQYYDSDHVCILANLAKCPIYFDYDKHKSYLIYDIKREWPIFDENTLTLDATQDVLCVLPKLNNSRIIKQDGAFFIFGMGKEKRTPAELLDTPTTILVKANAKKDILNELDLLGINEASLFPETDKVMHQIREEFCES